MKVEMRADTDELTGWLGTVFRDQIPFATSLALTGISFDIRDAQRARAEDRFTIRRAFVTRGLAVAKRATKTDLEAIVHVAPDRGFLMRHEDGGVFTPEEASRHAIPDAARRTSTGMVRASEKPRSFNFVESGSGPKATVFQGSKRAFMIQRKDGSGGVYKRDGRKGRGRRMASHVEHRRTRDMNVRTLFRFTRQIRIRSQLGFHLTAQEVFDREFEQKFAAAWDRALRTAR